MNKPNNKVLSLFPRPGNKPLEHSLQVCFLLGADSVATNFTVHNGFQVELIDEFVHGQLGGQVRLVTKDKEWNALEC